MSTLGPRGVLAGMAAGSVLALHSTIGTDECAEIADAAAARGVDVIDAPVSGGGAVAAEGRLTVYVGGADDAVARARPVLETYGDPVLHMGALGSGLRTKLLNNALNAAHFALAHDAFAIGAALGLDPTTLGEALRNGSGRSFSLEVFVGLALVRRHRRPRRPDHVEGHRACSSGRPAAAPDRAVLLDSADRFLELLGHPRGLADGGAPMSRADSLRGRASTPAPVRSATSAPSTPQSFWDGEWRDALARNGERAADDAERLGLPPLAIAVDGDVWTLRRGERNPRGRSRTATRRPCTVALDRDAFADLVRERRTALGLVIGGAGRGRARSRTRRSARGIPCSARALDGRGVYRPGDVTLARARRLAARPRPAVPARRSSPPRPAHFLAEAGFLLLQGVFTDDEMDAVDADLARAVDAARPDDGASWWATTRAGERYPCRILDFARKSRGAARAARRSPLPRDRRAARRRPPPRRPVRRALRRGHRGGAW